MPNAIRRNPFWVLNLQCLSGTQRGPFFIVSLLAILFTAATCFGVQDKNNPKPRKFRKLTSAEYQTEFEKWINQGYILDSATVKVVQKRAQV